jgi:hypothetical protein
MRERSIIWENCVRTREIAAGMVALTTSCPPGFVLWRLCLVFILFFTSSSLPLFFGGLILRFETDSIRFFCVGLIYDVSWVFPPKEFNQSLTRSQIGSNHGLGFENQCFSLPLWFFGDLLGLRRWSSRSSLQTRYWSSLQSFKSFWDVLIKFWAWNRFFPRAARKYQTCPILIPDESSIFNFRVSSSNLVETFPMVSRGYG